MSSILHKLSWELFSTCQMFLSHMQQIFILKSIMSYLSRPKHIWKAPKNFQRHSEGVAMLSSSLVSCFIKLEILRQQVASFYMWTFFSRLNFHGVKFLTLLFILRIFQIYYTSNFIFSSKYVIQDSHSSNFSAGQKSVCRYSVWAGRVWNPQGRDSYWKCEIWQVYYFKQWTLRKRPEQAEDHSYRGV